MKGIEKLTSIKSFLSINKPCQFPELFANVLYDEGLRRLASRGSGHSLAVLDQVNENDVTAVWLIDAPITGRQSACIGERAKVDNLTVSFDYPCRVLTANRSERVGIQILGHGLVVGQIFDLDKAGSRGVRGSCDCDLVSSRYSDV